MKIINKIVKTIGTRMAVKGVTGSLLTCNANNKSPSASIVNLM